MTLSTILQPVWDKFANLPEVACLPQEVGHILSVDTGIVQASGMPGVQMEEIVRFASGISGMVLDLDETHVSIAVLGDSSELKAGAIITRTGTVLDVPVGKALLGRVVNALGEPIDSAGIIRATHRLPVERPAAAILDRAPVILPLQTGIKVIDALIPVGLGQRELILGDRQTGKTAIAIDTIVNQKGKNVICIYCAIGRQDASVVKVISELKEHGAMEYSIVMVAGAESAPALEYIAPYAAMSMGEYFMEQGKDVLVVLDDLTQHAQAWRELSLLMRHPPGREAFPGDIFHIHSRLLERATHLTKSGGSLTALPIIETQAQDISAYIPTNLISITDGQIYLSPDLFSKGVLPAVDVGKSVSRVGGKAQFPAYQKIAGALKLSYAQFEEIESFARFGTRLDDETKKTLTHGRHIRECLKQDRLAALPVEAQIIQLFAATSGCLNSIPLSDIPKVQIVLQQLATTLSETIIRQIHDGKILEDNDLKNILQLITEALKPYQPKEENASIDGSTQKTHP